MFVCLFLVAFGSCCLLFADFWRFVFRVFPSFLRMIVGMCSKSRVLVVVWCCFLASLFEGLFLLLLVLLISYVFGGRFLKDPCPQNRLPKSRCFRMETRPLTSTASAWNCGAVMIDLFGSY